MIFKLEDFAKSPPRINLNKKEKQMIRGVTKKTYAYVLEDDRANPASEQTVFHIIPKTGHDNNLTLQRYAGTAKDNRKGFREINVQKLDSADLEEFVAVVKKVENYGWPEDHPMFEKSPVSKEITDELTLKEVARTLSADHLSEIWEVSNNINKLSEGSKKNSNC